VGAAEGGGGNEESVEEVSKHAEKEKEKEELDMQKKERK
jgi:hypothetical protein